MGGFLRRQRRRMNLPFLGHYQLRGKINGTSLRFLKMQMLISRWSAAVNLAPYQEDYRNHSNFIHKNSRRDFFDGKWEVGNGIC